MKRQFAALDDFVRELKKQEPFKDLVVWVVLKKSAEKRLTEMVESRRLPVLQDTQRVDFERLYGASKAKGHFVFGQDGCLVPTQLESSTILMAHPERILPALRAGL
ncbi:MAG: hypothetical protein KAY24_04390 [Candidatus Eisenbacteria sp.]|nr:hypothetical protein [Candidatus Eisenbacteria bacterium]